jgi:hypothetical protein
MKIDRVGISIRRFSRHLNLELIVWMTGLIYLAIINPAGEKHLSFCVFRLLGVDFCPGCGLGRSISFLLHGDLSASWQAHPLGVFALVILVLRIVVLIKARRPSIQPEKIATILRK